jgi:two-component system sensor histidine kinase and response regulator WspE
VSSGPGRPDDSLGGFPLFDLFRMEAEAHGATLAQGLLALESEPGDPVRLEELMRAAHSIKGAARIVRVEPIVRVAHAMEDAFVGAQKGLLTLGPAAIDALLSGADFLKSIAAKDEAAATAFLAAHAGETEALVARLQAVARGETPAAAEAAPPTPSSDAPAAPAVPSPPAPKAAPAVPSGPAAPSTAPSRRATPAESVDASVVRISAAGLGHMLAFAGETLVEARRLGTVSADFEELRRVTRQLEAEVDALAGETTVSSAALRQTVLEARRVMTRQVEALAGAARRSEDLAGRLYREVLQSRMRPFGEGAGGFPRLVRDLSRELGKRVRFELLGKDVLVDRDVLEKLDAPLNHLLRNALDHGIETAEARAAAGKPPEARIALEARHRAGMLEVEVVDDGRGVDYEALRAKVVERGLIGAEFAKDLTRSELLEFLFLPGFSTRAVVTEISGRGVGLDVVQTTARELGGSVVATSETGKGLRFVLTLPITRSVVRAALAQIAGEPYAFPLTRIERVLRVDEADVRAVEGREQFAWEGRPVGLLPAAQVLGLPPPARSPGAIPVILIGSREHYYGLAVDRFLGEQDLVVRPLDPRLGKVAGVSAVSVDEAGDPVVIVDVEDLLRSIDAALHQGRMRAIRVTGAGPSGTARAKKRVLVVDDSITVREVERGLLAARGYLVDVAVDGMDGWNAVRAGSYALVISDVDMPRMDGIELVRRIKQDERLKKTPVMIVSYKDREEDRLRGLEAGADAYVTKSSFQEENWIGRVVDLIGESTEENA